VKRIGLVTGEGALLVGLLLGSACSPAGAGENVAACGDACGGDCSTLCPAGQSYGGDGGLAPDGSTNRGPTDIGCGGSSPPKCENGKTCAINGDCTSRSCPRDTKLCSEPRSDDGFLNGSETDVDCGGPSAPKCAEAKTCLVASDCAGACGYAMKCVDAPSCQPHLGGDTCGQGEVGEPSALHESCCRTLPVPGYVDPKYPGKAVYLDKYEITTGRVRAFIDDIRAKNGGKPNIKAWVATHTPPIWDASWNKFLPSDTAAETTHVAKELLGDTRPGAESPPPAADEDRNVGMDFQFNGQLLVYIHGNNCSTHVDSYGFPTFFYPPNILALQSSLTFPPRVDGLTATNAVIPASGHLEVKSMNCITNALLAAFCAWDGGQLATDKVLDFVTATPSSLGNDIGCGTQQGDVGTGGRCAARADINATFDAGRTLPVGKPELNPRNYFYPTFAGTPTHDTANQVAAPGRGNQNLGGRQVDVVRINPGDEPWMDLHGNLNEAVIDMEGAAFTGKFGLKYRGLGYSSARSQLNVTPDAHGVRRLERPEARSAFAGGRCMRFK
jgi:hypothetical protein